VKEMWVGAASRAALDVGKVDGALAEALVQFVHHAAEALLAVVASIIKERNSVQFAGNQVEEPDADL